MNPGFGLAVLTIAFALSQAFRTLPSIILPGVQAHFSATPAELGQFAAAFHLSFALMQLPVGVSLDRFGIHWTVSPLLLLGAAGAGLCAAATSLPMLYIGQAMVGAGCAPALMAAMVLIARFFPEDAFAAMSGVVMSVGSIGILLTASPFEWLIQATSWRTTFTVLGFAMIMCFVGGWLLLPSETSARQTAGIRETLSDIRSLPLQRMGGLLLLAFVSYSAVVTLRAVWFVPMLIHRHGLTLGEAGRVLFVVSLAMAISPLAMGSLHSRIGGGVKVLICSAAVLAILFALLAIPISDSFLGQAFITTAIGLLSSMNILQYAYVRSLVNVEMAGRTLTLVNCAVFLGIASAQWGTGLLGEWALGFGADLYTPILWALSLFVASGAIGFALLPKLERE